MTEGGVAHLLFSFHGRITRGKFWLGFLVYIIIMVLSFVFFIASMQGDHPPTKNDIITSFLIGNLLGIPATYIAFAVFVKRLHDIGHPGCWSFMYLMPFGIFIMPIWLGTAEGVRGANEYGADPRAESRM